MSPKRLGNEDRKEYFWWLATKSAAILSGTLSHEPKASKKVASLTRWRKEPIHRLIGRYEHTAHVRLIAGLARVSAFRLVQVPSRIEIQQARRIRTVIFRKGVCRTLIEITCLEDGVALGIPFVEHRTGETVHQSAETAHLFIPPGYKPPCFQAEPARRPTRANIRFGKRYLSG